MERLARQMIGALVCFALLHSWFGHDLLHGHYHSDLDGSNYTLVLRNQDVPRALDTESPMLPTRLHFSEPRQVVGLALLPGDTTPAHISRTEPNDLLPRPPPVQV